MATKWLKESEKAGSKKESTIFRAHIAMTVWPASPLDTEMASRLLSNASFVRTWHVANGGSSNSNDSENQNEEKDAEENTASSLGVAEQEIYWLIQNKRIAMIDYLTYEAADEDIRQILISAVQSTTGDSESYKMWNAADISIGSDENKNGEIVTYQISPLSR